MSSRKQAVVIGAGPGGYVAAIRLAQLGVEVTLIDKEYLGGVCLNVGCIPSKAYIYAAGLVDKLKGADKMGILVDEPKVELGKLKGWKDKIVKQLTGGIGGLCKSHKIEVIMGTARLLGDQRIHIEKNDGGEETIEAEQILVATGSSPIELPFLKLKKDRIVNSTGALELTEIPKRLVVIGGGYIGLELGMAYQKLGSELYVVELLDRILPGTDPELVEVVAKQLKRRKTKVYTDHKALGVEETDDGLRLKVAPKDGGDEFGIDCDVVLVSVGRYPNVKNIGLEDAGVKLDDSGHIEVDNQLRTSQKGIFAIGDVVGHPYLAHKASKEGLVAAEAMCGQRVAYDVLAMPAACFTDPEIATVGLTEDEAKEEGHEVKVGRFPFAASGRALSTGERDGFVKVIADAESDLLLGVGIVGPHASDLIAEAALALEMGARAEDLALTVHAHPTLPESLMEAAEDVHDLAIHYFRRKR